MVRKRLAGWDRGSVAVEFALIIPVLLLLVMGTIDWGFYFFTREIVVNAAREGARTGSVADPTNPTQAITDATNAATNYLANAVPRGTPTVTCQVLRAGTATQAVQCEITYNAGSLTGLLGGVMPARITARSEMRY